MTSVNLDTEEFIKKFHIPSYVLEPESKDRHMPFAPECPVLVFINSKSGGQLGGNLLITYRSILNGKQVIDLREEAPDQVLRRVFLNLQRLKNNGDKTAPEIEQNLKIIVAGGDGTAGWLLGVVSDLKLSQPPPIATMPLGTGNNLPFAFGWGKKNPGTDRNSVLSFMNQVHKAKEMKIDSWHILMRMRAKKECCEPVPPLEDLPHSLHAFHHVSPTDDLNVEGCDTFRGGFWNYFSMGMDAQVSYGFHSERKRHPEKFKNQLINQGTYGKLVFASLFQPTSRNIAELCKVKVMKKRGDEWKSLDIPHSIRSIVCLNLPSFSGGLNPWGTPNSKKRRDRGLTPPFVDDGRIEIVGFRDAWHGLVLLAPNGHGRRLAQVLGNDSFYAYCFNKLSRLTSQDPHEFPHINLSEIVLVPLNKFCWNSSSRSRLMPRALEAHRIRFEFHKGATDHTYMRIDGEPWKQPLPVDDETVVVEISHLGQVKMLAVHDCRAKSILDPLSPIIHDVDEKDSDVEDESKGDEWRKFGAAETFKIPDEVDISQLS